MSQLKTLTVGIPAYNEASNIRNLLTTLLLQIEDGYVLDKIIVVSDGSNDATAKEVASLNDSRIIFKDDGKRIGKSARLEQLLRLNTSDILVLIDADVTIDDQSLFAKLVKNVDWEKNGIVAVNAQTTKPKTFFEHILNASVVTTKLMSEKWNNGNNYLSFKGCFLALDSSLIRQIHVPEEVINNDAYLYFAAVEKGFTPGYVRDCVVYYHSPKTLTDHNKQSSRFQLSKQELNAYFGDKITNAYKVPVAIILTSVLQSFLKQPFFLLAYLGVNVATKMKKEKNITTKWSIARSTKRRIAASN